MIKVSANIDFLTAQLTLNAFEERIVVPEN